MRRMLLALALCAPASADVLDVPREYPTIQAAIDAAVDGDEVVVEAGVYSERIDYLGKTIHIRSVDGPESTRIAPPAADRAITMIGAGRATLDGFLVTGGSAQQGGGILIRASSPTIRRCIFDSNDAVYGGAAFVSSNNDVRFEEVTFIRGIAHVGAGALVAQGRVLFWNCQFLDNWSYMYGGGIACGGSGEKETNVVNCLFAGNSANWGGGVMASGSVRIANCTMAENLAVEGADVDVSCDTTIINTIAYSDSPRPIFDRLCTADVLYSNVRGGYPGEGNIDTEPEFGPGFALAETSRCIDAGWNVPQLSFIRIDLLGLPRLIDDPNVLDTGRGAGPLVDMGAFEHQGQ